VNGAATYSLLAPALLDVGAAAPVLVGAEDANLAALSLSP
jgi:hypothetical protein